MATAAQDMGMPQEDRITRLHAVEDELRLTLAGLDTASTQCDDCGYKSYRNWNEKQTAEAIQGAITRVVKACRFISEGATHAQGDHT